MPESGADDQYREIHGDLNLRIFESALRHVIGQVDAFHVHVAADGMAASELAVEAGQRAFKSGLLESVDALIPATTTPDRPCRRFRYRARASRGHFHCGFDHRIDGPLETFCRPTDRGWDWGA